MRAICSARNGEWPVSSYTPAMRSSTRGIPSCRSRSIASVRTLDSGYGQDGSIGEDSSIRSSGFPEGLWTSMVLAYKNWPTSNACNASMSRRVPWTLIASYKELGSPEMS